jgi:adenylate kinase family enzyme
MLAVGENHPCYVPSPLLTKKIAKYHTDMKELGPFLAENCNYLKVSSDQSVEKTLDSVYKEIEPTVIHVRCGDNQRELQNTVVSELSTNHGFVALDVKKITSGESNRATMVGKRYWQTLASSKVAPSSLTVKMLNRIIYSGQPALNKFILVNFPDDNRDIEQTKAFEDGCAKISAIVYPHDK